MDIFKMANEIAKNMSLDDKDSLDNMDMNEMISHVTKNVLGMMNNPNGPMAQFPFKMPEVPPNGQFAFKQPEQQVEVNEESESESESVYILPKTPDITFELNVDLEDFYTGKKKKLNVKRKRVVEIDGRQTIIEEKKKLVIPIERGMRDEQQIRFEGEADQIPGYKPGDIIITLIENEHATFQRDNDNLIIIKNINLYQNYNYTFDIKHLDGTVYRINSLANEALHLNDSIRKISDLGMPSYKSTRGEYGDLFIRFNLVIPKSLNPDNLEKLHTIFKDDPLFLENKLGPTFEKQFVLEMISDADLEDLEDFYSESSESSGESEESEESEISDDSSSSSSEEEEVVVVKKKSLNKK
jgi:DnaJ-class molecular chaperone